MPEVKKVIVKSIAAGPDGKPKTITSEESTVLRYTRHDALMLAWHARKLTAEFFGEVEDAVAELASVPDSIRALDAPMVKLAIEARALELQNGLDDLGRRFKCPWPVKLTINRDPDFKLGARVTFPDGALCMPETHEFTEGAFGPEYAEPPTVEVSVGRR